MKQIVCFKVEESPYNPGKLCITPVHDNFFLKHTKGSFNVICARLMNLSYAQYLRFCRDLCGGEIIGKGSKYPVVYFPHGERVQALCRLLNSRANLVLWCRDNPNWRQHQDELKEWEAKANVFNKRDTNSI
jgi:hypothetical protein